MEKLGRKRSEKSRDAVLQATRELVTESGFTHVTIEKIAARAHVGKPTIYRWWQSKNAILAECVLGGEVLPAVDETSASEIHTSASEWFRAVLGYVDENAALLRGLVAAAYEDPEIAAQLRAHLGDPIEAALIEWAGGAGRETPLAGELSPHALAQLLFGAILYRLAPTLGATDASDVEMFDVLIARLHTQ
ncbi:TetR/AcrR family transcriptional regulator [Subtercola lobariae]|uniref:TetR family transcriptional regulator n=1 Tax=Subtercola lobariae TaxID=1588641 RepID=A0A917EVV3_9MICO|nr:TetR/AcrR family transcriptional regulator [Subtercola lobariae]GGF22453.1 TetR family transcriptional regulator [Subtercola lobariae]